MPAGHPRRRIRASGVSVLAASVAAIVAAAEFGWVAVPWVAPLLVAAYAAARAANVRIDRHLDRVQQLYDFTRVLAGAPDLGATARTALARTRAVLHCERAELLLVGADGPTLWVSLGDTDDLTPVVRPLHADPSLTAVLAGGSAGDAGDGDDDGATRGAPVLVGHDTLVAPLRSEDRVFGLLIARGCPDAEGQGSHDNDVFEAVANHTALSLQRDELVARLRKELDEKEHLTLHDPLTGLPNRRAFHREVGEAVRDARMQGPAASVLMVDLIGFKDVNDSLGHATGDLLLTEVARRVVRAAGAGARVARLGGDEFGVLLRTDQAGAAAVGEQVIAAVGSPYTIDGLRLLLASAVGVASAPVHAPDAQTLLQRAGLALYGAKERRAEHPHLYDAGDDRLAARRMALASDLRGAIERGELTVVFQPKADVTTGAITGAEALLRWQHPDHGYVPPDEFVAIAEQTGTIAALTRYVLDRAIATAAGWRRSGLDLGVAVNVSTRNLLDPKLPEAVLALLEVHGLPASSLTLEITESELMQDATRTLETLGRFSDAGVDLSIDDFGTGYSSLAYLKRLPVDEVKIDKSFVSGLAVDPEDAAIARAIVDLARSLGLRVVAEGVEDQRSWDILRLMGCDLAQGYFLSRPIAAPELERWLVERRAAASASASASAQAHRPG